MNTKLSQLIHLFKKELIVFHGISLGVFFFILFFQPFQHSISDFYYRLLFYVGFGVLVFLIMFFVRILYPCMMEKNSQSENEITLPSYVSGFAIWALSSFAFVFYLKYVAFISISGYIVYKVILICLVPPVVLLVYDRMGKLKTKNELLISEIEQNQKQLNKNVQDCGNSSIDFKSGMNGQKFSLLLKEILFIKSANNYVEIYYLEEDQIKKKLLRNTLANIELQVESYPSLVRCHRTCVVNTLYIEKLNGKCNNHTLAIRGYHKQIRVSRKHYLKVREAI